MSHYALYQDNANIVGRHSASEDAVRQAATIAALQPALSTVIGVVEVSDETGMAIGPFRSVAQFLADGDEVATAAVREHQPAEARRSGEEVEWAVRPEFGSFVTDRMLCALAEESAGLRTLSTRDLIVPSIEGSGGEREIRRRIDEIAGAVALAISDEPGGSG